MRKCHSKDARETVIVESPIGHSCDGPRYNPPSPELFAQPITHLRAHPSNVSSKQETDSAHCFTSDLNRERNLWLLGVAYSRKSMPSRRVYGWGNWSRRFAAIFALLA